MATTLSARTLASRKSGLKTKAIRKSKAASTPRRARKQYSSKRWPPPDSPSARHVETAADFGLSSAGKIRLAAKRLETLRLARAVTPPGGETAAPIPGANNWTELGPFVMPNGQVYRPTRVLVPGRVTAIAINPRGQFRNQSDRAKRRDLIGSNGKTSFERAMQWIEVPRFTSATLRRVIWPTREHEPPQQSA
jgi:hypothetical protein